MNPTLVKFLSILTSTNFLTQLRSVPRRVLAYFLAPMLADRVSDAVAAGGSGCFSVLPDGTVHYSAAAENQGQWSKPEPLPGKPPPQ